MTYSVVAANDGKSELLYILFSFRRAISLIISSRVL